MARDGTLVDMASLRSTAADPSRRHRRRVRAASASAASAFVLAVAAAFAAITPGAAEALGIRPTETRNPPTGADGSAVAHREKWSWPVPAPIRVVSPFRAPPTPYAAGHRGIDIAAGPGAPVVAPADGVVSFAGPVAGRGVLAIDHGDGVVSAIEPVDAIVTAGTRVAAGEPVAVVASGGHCADTCVHFGVRVDGEYVSPLLFFGGIPLAVLLPMG
jgi:murein DD-endopeptidase MepM/ murein hydrolase activator NlpD